MKLRMVRTRCEPNNKGGFDHTFEVLSLKSKGTRQFVTITADHEDSFTALEHYTLNISEQPS